MSNWIKTVARGGTAAAIGALLLVGCQDAGPAGPLPAEAPELSANPNPGIIPRNARPFGKTYEEWKIASIKWSSAIPAARNPALDETGEFCAEEQSGKLWFLAGRLEPGTSVRECHVPAGTALYVPLIGFIGWAPEDLGIASFVVETFLGLDPATLTDEEIIRFAVNWMMDLVTHLSLRIDGVPYDDLFSYRAETPAFNLSDTDLWDDLGFPISTSSLVVADGYAVILTPLPAGSHTLEIRAESLGHPLFGDVVFDVTYHLTVGPTRGKAAASAAHPSLANPVRANAALAAGASFRRAPGTSLDGRW